MGILKVSRLWGLMSALSPSSRLPSVMAAAGVSVLFGVGVTAAPLEEPIPPWGNYCFWAELLCPFLPLPSLVPPLLLQFRVKWSNRSMDRSTQKLGLAFFRSKSWLGVHLLEREILCTYSGHCVFPPLNCSHLVPGFRPTPSSISFRPCLLPQPRRRRVCVLGVLPWAHD